MQLYEDLERLPLDLRGVWTDESASPDDTHPPIRGAAFEQPAQPRGPAAAGTPASFPRHGGAIFGQPVPANEREPNPSFPRAHLLPPAESPAME
jgi:hypothetical protein